MPVGRDASGPLIDAATMGQAGVPVRLLLLGAVRSVGVVALTLGVYALAPIREETALAIGVGALAGMAALGVVFVRQMGRISRSPHPVLAAVEALALVFGMFLSLFAFLYVALSASDPGAFTQPVDKVAGVYFSVTVLATVGFGDISAVSDVARVAVTVQMVADLVLIGTALKLLGSSARRAVQAKVEAAAAPPESDAGGMRR